MGATEFVLFIVEGETDELALGRALTSLFASGEHPGPRFGIVRGDITSVHALGAGNPASTIKRRLVDTVKEFLAKDKKIGLKRRTSPRCVREINVNLRVLRRYLGRMS